MANDTKIERSYQELINYCDKKLEEGKELHWEDMIPVWRILWQVRKELNPGCNREWSDFRTRLCQDCRDSGTDITICDFLTEIDELIVETFYAQA